MTDSSIVNLNNIKNRYILLVSEIKEKRNPSHHYLRQKKVKHVTVTKKLLAILILWNQTPEKKKTIFEFTY